VTDSRTTPPPEGPDRPRVLVVEDSFLLAEVLASMLTELGYEVAGPAPTPAGALEIAEGERVDAALLDVRLRGELVTPVADRLAAAGVPFAFITAYSTLDDLPEAHRRVVTIPKPCDVETLSARLTEMLPGTDPGPSGPRSLDGG
jgi:DNA-binding response OmpR family regulator